jgi:hypothetical protein
MSGNIYVVELCTGEYDCAEQYPMCAWYLEEDAINYVNRVNAELKEQNLFWSPNKHVKSGTFTFDDDEYSIDYTGAEASYYPILLRGI